MSSPQGGVGQVHSARPIGAVDPAKAARHTPQPKQQPVQQQRRPSLAERHKPVRKMTTGGAK